MVLDFIFGKFFVWSSSFHPINFCRGAPFLFPIKNRLSRRPIDRNKNSLRGAIHLIGCDFVMGVDNFKNLPGN